MDLSSLYMPRLAFQATEFSRILENSAYSSSDISFVHLNCIRVPLVIVIRMRFITSALLFVAVVVIAVAVKDPFPLISPYQQSHAFNSTINAKLTQLSLSVNNFSDDGISRLAE